MRFGTKILLLMLAMTVGLSGVIVWAVTTRITAAETARAHEQINQAIADYRQRIAERGSHTMHTVHLLLEYPQNRAYLQALNESGPNADPHSLAQIEEEILAREMQTELGTSFVPPAFHVLTNWRGEVVAAAATDRLLQPQDQHLMSHPWPASDVIESGELQEQYVALAGRLFLALGMPLRVEIRGDWVMAYFVGFEIDDEWLDAVFGGRRDEPLGVVVRLDGKTVARFSSDPDVEATLAQHTTRTGTGDQNVQFPIEFHHAGEQFVGEAMTVPTPAGQATFAFYSSLTRALAPLRRLQLTIALLTGGVIVLAVVVSRLMSRLLARPVEQLVAGTERIARGEFDIPIDLRRRDELGTLARSFNQMAAGLKQRDLIKDTFGKFVDPTIVQSLLDDPSRLKLGGERRVQTILFADLENFSALGERLDPESLFKLLNGYLEHAADVVTRHRGIIDKFIGDGVVAFWGPPMEADHALQACRAALALVRPRIEQLPDDLRAVQKSLRVRVGIATGEVLVGNIGSKSKYNYTVMGDVANLASRLEGVNKLYGTRILITDRTRREAGAEIIARRIDTVRVLGRSEPVELWELLGEANQVDGQLDERLKQYEAALSLYHARRWIDARQAFDHIDDAPSRAMAGRCAVFEDQQPAATWDGVWSLDRK